MAEHQMPKMDIDSIIRRIEQGEVPVPNKNIVGYKT